MESAANYLCEVCKLPIASSERVKHTDYHYAQQLQATVRADDRKRREDEEQSRRQQRKSRPNRSGPLLDNYVKRVPAPRGVSHQPTLPHRSGSDGGAKARDIGSFFNTEPT